MGQLDILEEYLIQHGYKYERIDKERTALGYDWGRHQIVVHDNDNRYLWDAICHRGSYGYEQGLLEIMGTIVDITRTNGDVVEGWLTAQNVIDRLEENEHEDQEADDE